MAKKQVPSKKPRPRQSNVDEIEVEQENKGPGKLQKLFFWVIIPVLFTLAIGLIVAEVTGTNVFEKAKTAISGKESNKDVNKETAEQYNQQIVSLKAQLKEKDAIVNQLQTTIDTNKTDAAKAEVEKKRLEKEVTKLQNGKADTKTDMNALVKTYEQMAPKSASAVISAMGDDQALKILKNLKPATLAPIFEKMTPEKAAHFTELLSKKKKK